MIRTFMLVKACAKLFLQLSSSNKGSVSDAEALRQLVELLSKKDDAGWRRIIGGKSEANKQRSHNDEGPVHSRWCSAQGVVRFREALAQLSRLFAASTNVINVVEMVLDERAPIPIFPPKGTLIVTLRPLTSSAGIDVVAFGRACSWEHADVLTNAVRLQAN